jgi:hypothetical protein
MSNQQLELPGSERAALRALVATIDQQIASLSSHSTLESYREAASDLAAAWVTFGKLLALGEAAAMRECPNCKRFGIREASRCGYCWADLEPIPDLAAAPVAIAPAPATPSAPLQS